MATGVTPGLVRLAVGIEGIDDILADLERGLAAAKKVGARQCPGRGGVLSEPDMTLSDERVVARLYTRMRCPCLPRARPRSSTSAR